MFCAASLAAFGLYLLVSVPLKIDCTSLRAIPAPVFMSMGDAAIKRFDTNFILASSSVQKPVVLLPLNADRAVDYTQHQAAGQPTAPPAQDSAPLLGGKNVRSKYRTSSGKKYPTACQLYKDYPQNTLQYYQTVGDFSNTCFFLVKGGWLNKTELCLVSCAYPDLQDMIESVPGLLDIDFSSLRNPVLDYATQVLIEPARVELMTACAVHYNLDIGLVVRYLGGEYTASWRSIPDILNAAAPYVTERVLSHLRSVLTVGCPAEFNWNEPIDNKTRFIKRGNLPAVNQHFEVAQKTVVKEVRNSHLIPFASWVCIASAHARHTPQNVLIKPNKKPRLIWDGSSRKFWYESTMNMITPMDNELEVSFGDTFTKLCTWIWNLRITYPNEDILLAFVDISSCFRFPRIAADLAGAFGFIVGTCFFAANAGVFGSVGSASWWEPYRLAIAAIAQACFLYPGLVEKYANLLGLVHFDKEAPPNTTFVQARSCGLNTGVIDPLGSRLPTPHLIYVDDNLLAEVHSQMPQALASAFEGAFKVMGIPTPILRPIAVALEKLEELLVSYRQILLGLDVDTRAMTVSITSQYRNEVLSLLQSTWHVHRKTFTVKEMELLVGKLGRIAQAFRPLYYLMSHLYSSLAYALRENNAYLVTTSRRYRLMLQTSKQPIIDNDNTDRRRVTFAASKVAKAQHGCKQMYRIPGSLAAEIVFLTELMADSTIPLSTPIGHLVPRDDLFSMWADSCKTSGGGWSTDLKCWWYLEYPPEVVSRAMQKNNKHGTYISINTLEMLCVLVNYAAALHICWLDDIDLTHAPTMRNWCDNTSACSWINTRCKESLIGRALGRFLCGLLIGSNLGLSTTWLSTHDNEVADAISRHKRLSDDDSYDFSTLLTSYPLLNSCRRFQPTQLLLSMLWGILLNNDSPAVLMLSQLKPENLGSVIS